MLISWGYDDMMTFWSLIKISINIHDLTEWGFELFSSFQYPTGLETYSQEKHHVRNGLEKVIL